MGESGQQTVAHPAQWKGEPQLLTPFVDELLASKTLCDEVFATKNEALVTGLALEELRQLNGVFRGD